jgi:hypothetical protein
MPFYKIQTYLLIPIEFPKEIGKKEKKEYQP